jgi:ADP-L-glycero-D-manno-heptose 6-epimerase
MENYIKFDNSIIKQIKVNKIDYNYNYSNNYNVYGIKSKLSYLRLGILLGHLKKVPNSILDVGYGNGDFLATASLQIKNCYGSDLSDYPVPENCTKVDLNTDKYYDVICFFDSLEHFDDIDIIKNLNCEYIFISVPWCHNFSDEWFNKWYHRKPNEHLWHFNKNALINFFNNHNYDCEYSSNFEDLIRINSESQNYPNILSCIFKKRNNLNDKIKDYYKNKIILVTGGTGFVGRNLINELLNFDISEIIIFDRTIKYKWEDKRIKYIKGDLLIELNKIEELNFDICFHNAANVDTTCIDNENMINTNYKSFIKLVNICEEKNAKIIYASSAAVYGNTGLPNSVGINEIPLNIYGESKLMMDKYVKENKKKNIIIGLRYFNVYGPGEDHKSYMRSIIKQIIDKIKNNENVNLFEYGEQKRDFIYIKDVIKCNILAGFSNISNIYNCGYGKSTDFNQIFDIIKSYYKNESKLNYIKNNFDFFQNYTLADIDNTKEILYYEPYYDIKEGIYDYINYLSKF